MERSQTPRVPVQGAIRPPVRITPWRAAGGRAMVRAARRGWPGRAPQPGAALACPTGHRRAGSHTGPGDFHRPRPLFGCRAASGGRDVRPIMNELTRENKNVYLTI
ncbi:hypothetical protein SSAG_05552 [Streptomyces sp. Mg1]|nr:hypothetical protein SSAG_05552 [Streptomyces sp. Mg1]